MKSPSIIWVQTERANASRKAAQQLKGAGLAVVECPPGQSASRQAEIRVLPTDAFQNEDAFQQELRSDNRPTLILVESTTQAVAAFEISGVRDDVGQLTDPVPLLAQRIARLGSRAAEMERLGSVQNMDALTNLPNRRQFLAEVARQVEELLPGEYKALVFLDLDAFKRVNDRYGHGAGDRVLCKVGELLRRELAPSDGICRFGGDEFAILIGRYDERGCVADAEKMLQQIAQFDYAAIVHGAAERLEISASAGLSFLLPQSTPEEALKQAQMAMYEVKQNGRRRLAQFERLREPAVIGDEDLYLRHFENLTRVVSERVSNQIAQMGRRLVESARREVHEDATTHLRNRRYFDSRIVREIDIARKTGRPLTLGLMDLDRFHDVNMNFGWPSGDRVLQQFADIAAASIRQVDWLARYGGDEFCLIMPETDLALGSMVAERIRSQVQACQVMSIDGHPVYFTVSIGLIQFDQGMNSAQDLVQAAGNGLREAKCLGRNRVVLPPV